MAPGRRIKFTIDESGEVRDVEELKPKREESDGYWYVGSRPSDVLQSGSFDTVGGYWMSGQPEHFALWEEQEWMLQNAAKARILAALCYRHVIENERGECFACRLPTNQTEYSAWIKNWRGPVIEPVSELDEPMSQPDQPPFVWKHTGSCIKMSEVVFEFLIDVCKAQIFDEMCISEWDDSQFGDRLMEFWEFGELQATSERILRGPSDFRSRVDGRRSEHATSQKQATKVPHAGDELSTSTTMPDISTSLASAMPSSAAAPSGRPRTLRPRVPATEVTKEVHEDLRRRAAEALLDLSKPATSPAPTMGEHVDPKRGDPSPHPDHSNVLPPIQAAFHWPEESGRSDVLAPIRAGFVSKEETTEGSKQDIDLPSLADLALPRSHNPSTSKPYQFWGASSSSPKTAFPFSNSSSSLSAQQPGTASPASGPAPPPSHSSSSFPAQHSGTASSASESAVQFPHSLPPIPAQQSGTASSTSELAHQPGAWSSAFKSPLPIFKLNSSSGPSSLPSYPRETASSSLESASPLSHKSSIRPASLPSETSSVQPPVHTTEFGTEKAAAAIDNHRAPTVNSDCSRRHLTPPLPPREVTGSVSPCEVALPLASETELPPSPTLTNQSTARSITDQSIAPSFTDTDRSTAPSTPRPRTPSVQFVSPATLDGKDTSTWKGRDDTTETVRGSSPVSIEGQDAIASNTKETTRPRSSASSRTLSEEEQVKKTFHPASSKETRKREEKEKKKAKKARAAEKREREREENEATKKEAADKAAREEEAKRLKNERAADEAAKQARKEREARKLSSDRERKEAKMVSEAEEKRVRKEAEDKKVRKEAQDKKARKEAEDERVRKNKAEAEARAAEEEKARVAADVKSRLAEEKVRLAKEKKQRLAKEEQRRLADDARAIEQMNRASKQACKDKEARIRQKSKDFASAAAKENAEKLEQAKRGNTAKHVRQPTPAEARKEVIRHDASASDEVPKPANQHVHSPSVDGVPSKTRVAVFYIPLRYRDAQLKDLFAAYEPSSATVGVSPRFWHDTSRGFGWVNLASEEQQRNAIKEMHGKRIEGRSISVEVVIGKPHETGEVSATESVIKNSGEGAATSTEPAIEASRGTEIDGRKIIDKLPIDNPDKGDAVETSTEPSFEQSSGADIDGHNIVVRLPIGNSEKTDEETVAKYAGIDGELATGQGVALQGELLQVQDEVPVVEVEERQHLADLVDKLRSSSASVPPPVARDALYSSIINGAPDAVSNPGVNVRGRRASDVSLSSMICRHARRAEQPSSEAVETSMQVEERLQRGLCDLTQCLSESRAAQSDREKKENVVREGVHQSQMVLVETRAAEAEKERLRVETKRFLVEKERLLVETKRFLVEKERLLVETERFLVEKERFRVEEERFLVGQLAELAELCKDNGIGREKVHRLEKAREEMTAQLARTRADVISASYVSADTHSSPAGAQNSPDVSYLQPGLRTSLETRINPLNESPKSSQAGLLKESVGVVADPLKPAAESSLGAPAVTGVEQLHRILKDPQTTSPGTLVELPQSAVESLPDSSFIVVDETIEPAFEDALRARAPAVVDPQSTEPSSVVPLEASLGIVEEPNAERLLETPAIVDFVSSEQASEMSVEKSLAIAGDPSVESTLEATVAVSEEPQLSSDVRFHPRTNECLFSTFTCRYCHDRCDDLQFDPPNPTLCPRCGPFSKVRYCSLACLLLDATAHVTNGECQATCGEYQVNWNDPQLLRAYRAWYPGLPMLDGLAAGHVTPERWRQTLYGMMLYEEPVYLGAKWAQVTGGDSNIVAIPSGDYFVFFPGEQPAVLSYLSFEMAPSRRDLFTRLRNAALVTQEKQYVEWLYVWIALAFQEAYTRPSPDGLAPEQREIFERQQQGIYEQLKHQLHSQILAEFGCAPEPKLDHLTFQFPFGPGDTDTVGAIIRALDQSEVQIPLLRAWRMEFLGGRDVRAMAARYHGNGYEHLAPHGEIVAKANASSLIDFHSGWVGRTSTTSTTSPGDGVSFLRSEPTPPTSANCSPQQAAGPSQCQPGKED